MVSNENYESSFEDEETESPLILVVDDSRVIQKIAEATLINYGMRAALASSAKEAFDYLETGLPDLILSDIEMPDMGGIDFCKALKKDVRFKEIPVVFLTGQSKGETLSRAYRAGASDYISKPIDHVELIARTQKHIDDYRNRKKDFQRIQKLNNQNKSKTRVLGATSHDLRNPIASILGVAKFLDKERYGPLNEMQHDLVGIILEASDSMLGLVEDLLNVSMFESGNMTIQPERVSIEILVDKAISMHSISSSGKSIDLVKGAGLNDSFIQADPKLISRVIDNLIGNAIKFSEPNTRVKISIRGGADQVVLSVEDEGPGIPEGEFYKLFKEYSRTSNRPTREEPSTGLGLYLCRKIVENHKGKISAENRSFGGSRFSVTLWRKMKL